MNKNKAKIVGKNRIYFEEMPSTQLKAKELVGENIENGSVVITDNQTNGVGTHERKWYTTKGQNLTFTIILYPKCELDNLKSLTIDIAKIFVNTIYTLYGLRLGIEKPNDIVYNEKKMGGILTQISSKGKIVQHLLIGIGFNVNQVEFNEEIKDIATSMKKEFKRDFDKNEILDEFLYEFEQYLLSNEII